MTTYTPPIWHKPDGTPLACVEKIKVLNENNETIEKEEDILETPHLDSFLQEMLQENSLDQVDLSFFDNMDLMGNETYTQEQFNIFNNQFKFYYYEKIIICSGFCCSSISSL